MTLNISISQIKNYNQILIDCCSSPFAKHVSKQETKQTTCFIIFNAVCATYPNLIQYFTQVISGDDSYTRDYS